jgi:hypothetical protein
MIRRLFAPIFRLFEQLFGRHQERQPLTFHLFGTIIGRELAAKPGDELIRHPRGRNRAAAYPCGRPISHGESQWKTRNVRPGR